MTDESLKLIFNFVPLQANLCLLYVIGRWKHLRIHDQGELLFCNSGNDSRMMTFLRTPNYVSWLARTTWIFLQLMLVFWKCSMLTCIVSFNLQFTNGAWNDHFWRFFYYLSSDWTASARLVALLGITTKAAVWNVSFAFIPSSCPLIDQWLSTNWFHW